MKILKKINGVINSLFSIRTSAHLHICTLVLVFSQAAIAHDFAPVDSVGVKTIKGQKFILYKVGQGEGWYGIGRKYGLSSDELQLANKDIKALKPGQELLIPVKQVASAVEPKVQEEKKPVYQKVKKKDTLYSIATKAGVKVEEIKRWNNLTSDTLQTGQKLIVGYEEDKKKKDKPTHEGTEPLGPPAQVKEVKEERKDTTAVSKPESDKKNHTDSVKAVDTVLKAKKDTAVKSPVVKGREMEERGKASFIEDQDINPNKYYALHRTAPKGTIIKVTNIMNKKQIYVKVIGTLPDTGDNNDLIIKISKASAMKLNVLDYKFQVVLNYFGE